MKVQKKGLNFKINSARGKDPSSSKALSHKEKERRKTRYNKDLRSISGTNQIRNGAGTESNLSNANKLKLAHSRQKIVTRDSDNLKNSRRLVPISLTHIATGKTSALAFGIREEKIKEAKIRLAQGYYSRAKVYSKVAERIMDILT
jgi:hypothetical protein